MNLKVINGENTYNIECSPDKTILENLIHNNISISAPCNGRGSCGKCKVRLIQGKLVCRDTAGYGIKLDKDEYLACKSYLVEDCIIKLSRTESGKFSISQEFNSRNFRVNPELRRISLKIHEGMLSGGSLTKNINSKLNNKFHYELKALRKLSTLINESSKIHSSYCLYNNDEIYMVCEKNKVIDVFASKDDAGIYGIAVDIGTTTIVMSLIDIDSGDILHTESMLNSQRQFGADVISRIQYSMENGMSDINGCIRDDILEGIEKLIDQSGINKKSVYRIAISANNVMQHLFMGLYCDSMAVYPFTSITNNMVKADFFQLFKSRLLCSEVFILPSISSYVGGDIVSGIHVCGVSKSKSISMLLDIGTNGEMAIGNYDRILCTSTAAGPAFEGANIENGVGSVEGAICWAQISKREGKKYDVNCRTIGNSEPVGICGSGIVDITAELVKNGIIDSTGKFDSCNWNKNFISLTDQLVFTQKDIREVQMAKSAIRSGIEILMRRFGCTYNDIEKVYMAGGFGNRINLKNASAIGLVPEKFLDKIELVGNSSLLGAVEYIVDRDTKDDMEHIMDIAENINISMDDDFNKAFINNMSF